MMARKYLVLVVALVAWTGYFYVLDKSIMQGQGLPVGADLLPK